MSAKTEPAVCSGSSPKQTASKNQLQTPYLKAESLSSWKMLVGGILLYGDKKKDVFWPFFEAMLRQYIDLRISQSAFQGRSDCAESTNLMQRVSG